MSKAKFQQNKLKINSKLNIQKHSTSSKTSQARDVSKSSSLILCNKNTEHLRSWYVGTCLAGELQIWSISMDFQRKSNHQFLCVFQDMKSQMDSQIRKLDDPVSLPSGDDALKSELEDLKKQVRAMINGSHDYIKIHKDSVYCYNLLHMLRLLRFGTWNHMKSVKLEAWVARSWSWKERPLMWLKFRTKVLVFLQTCAVMRLLRMILIVLEVLDASYALYATKKHTDGKARQCFSLWFSIIFPKEMHLARGEAKALLLEAPHTAGNLQLSTCGRWNRCWRMLQTLWLHLKLRFWGMGILYLWNWCSDWWWWWWWCQPW